MHNNRKTNSAVSLVELAIVILVLGILVAVVTGSNSLVKSAKVRKATNEIDVLVSAHRTFESTYDAVAGDMIDAYDFFGSDCASASGLCNGDGDTKVEGASSASASSADSADAEYLRYFQHLKLANVLEGNYSGEGAVSTAKSTACTATDKLSATCIRARGYNVPKTQLSTRGYYMVNYNTTYENNTLTLGDTDTDDYTGINDSAFITAIDAKSLDLKLDDGLAATGKVRGQDGGASSNCLSSSEYDPVTSGDNCYVEYIIR